MVFFKKILNKIKLIDVQKPRATKQMEQIEKAQKLFIKFVHE